MKYLSFVRSAEALRDTQPPAALMEAMGKLIERFSASGALVDTGGLAPSRAGFRMRLAGGKLTTTDGPFTETKEVIGGWAILQANSHEELVRLVTEFMDVHRRHWPEFEGECEVRPIEFLASDAPGGHP
ncbi:MAG: YciI family protein [Nannocystaceae bacterium]|nr:YciI family protein [Nannocystaceae bacterium]